jgi:hypothetical protein
MSSEKDFHRAIIDAKYESLANRSRGFTTTLLSPTSNTNRMFTNSTISNSPKYVMNQKPILQKREVESTGDYF